MKVNKIEKVKPLPVFTPSPKQRKWIEEEKEETGNSFASILRGLMEEAANKKAKGSK